MPKTASVVRTYRFDQMARMINDRVDDPAESGVERYVGLEHLDADSLRIRRWGEITDVESTKLRFKPGDIVFGKRRVYQRKLAVADFEGICSAHAMVLRARPDVVLPEFLPFFMQGELFMERALAISVGSLSPTINWTDLAAQEFALPPIEEQRRLAGVLTAADRAIYSSTDLAESLVRLEGSVSDSFVDTCEESGCVGDIVTSTAYGCSKKSTDGPGGVPILGIPNVSRGRLEVGQFNRVELTDSEVQRYRVLPGDVLLVRTNGNPHYVGRCVVVSELPRDFVYASYLIRLRVDSTVAEPAFVASMLNAPAIRRELRGTVRSSAGNYNINTTEIKDQAIPLPSIATQLSFLDRVAEIRSRRTECEDRTELLRRTKAAVLRKVSS